MQDPLQVLDRSRPRWRAVALALGLGHVLTLLLVGFLLFRLEEVHTKQVHLEVLNQALEVELRLVYERSQEWIAEEYRREVAKKRLQQAKPLP